MDVLFFSPTDGQIWLNNQRMVLFQSSVIGIIQREILKALGRDAGRALLERISFMQGSGDAQMVRERWPDVPLSSQSAIGPLLHALNGYGKVDTLTADYDPHRRVFYGEFSWKDTVEDSEYLATLGQSDSPCCWMQCAYASGYASTLLGLPILVHEVECQGAGDGRCLAIMTNDMNLLHGKWGAVSSPTFRPPFPVLSSRSPSSLQQTPMVGSAAAFVAARSLLERVAPTAATVLLCGESGTGKEFFAKTLHEMSDRRNGPFVAVNCAALPENLIESELFGVERGAFTGAAATRLGRFERAHRGTLFLDEIASMSAAAQSKLLRALQEREIERVGGTRSIPVDVRVVAATNVDLWDEVEAGRFRRDLLFRLNVFPIDIPPLRERTGDISLLADHFLEHYAARYGKTVPGFTPQALAELLDYGYPGNIREMQNLIERGVICVNNGEPIGPRHIFRNRERAPRGIYTVADDGRLQTNAAIASGQASPSVRRIARAPEPPASRAPPPDADQDECLAAVEACAGNISAAARLLGLTRPTLEYRLRKWGLLKKRGSPLA